MGMNVGHSQGDDEVMVDINTTPLIDVMLVLLIMLIITIPVQKHAVKLDMPVNQQTPPVQEPLDPVTLEVDFDGTLYWNGAPVAAGAELNSRLSALAHQSPQPEFHVKPNRLAAYKHVVNVMASAQKLGVDKLGLVQGG